MDGAHGDHGQVSGRDRAAGYDQVTRVGGPRTGRQARRRADQHRPPGFGDEAVVGAPLLADLLMERLGLQRDDVVPVTGLRGQVAVRHRPLVRGRRPHACVRVGHVCPLRLIVGRIRGTRPPVAQALGTHRNRIPPGRPCPGYPASMRSRATGS